MKATINSDGEATVKNRQTKNRRGLEDPTGDLAVGNGSKATTADLKALIEDQTADESGILIDGARAKAELAQKQHVEIPMFEGVRYYAAKITGASPIILNRFVEEPEVVAAIGRQPKDLTKLDEWRKQEAELRLYLTDDGKPYLPSRNIRSAMIQGADAAALTHKHGRFKRALGPFLRRGLNVEPLELVIEGDGHVMHRDVVRIPPGRGAMVVKYWPKFPKWGLSFTLAVFDPSLQADDELLASLAAAGIYCGVGTNRPDFGKFRVASFAEVTPKS